MVLVEGVSDQVAVESLAARYGRDLPKEGVQVIPMGGAMGIGRFLDRFGSPGLDVMVTGMCDAGEQDYFRRGLERAGMGSDLIAADMESLGFYVCHADLEEELIRALGISGVEEVMAATDHLSTFRTFQRQPAQRGRTTAQHMRRFMGTQSGRKSEYARMLVHALDLNRVPRPLDRLLAHVA